MLIPQAINKADPLAKLLYATLWKNGDLPKIKHIVQGIIDCGEEDIGKEDGLVFYQFGKCLTGTDGEPIIDQHVIRAFAIHKHDESETDKYRKFKSITKDSIGLIRAYKEWLRTEANQELRSQTDYAYYIDQLLFALGRMIKSKKYQF